MWTTSDRVLLPDGRLVPASLWAWLVLQHARGLRVTAEAGRLAVRPRGRLTPEDRAFATTHRTALLELLTQPPADAPLPAGWRARHVLAGSVDELLAACDAAPRPRRVH